MILVDFNQIALATVFQELGGKVEVNEEILRHMVLNSLRAYRVKFAEKYGDLVICCDGKQSWRKLHFANYKAHRAKNRNESPINWGQVFSALEVIRTEISEIFHWPLIHIDHVEADDIIAVLTKSHGVDLNMGGSEKILILSSDKDFAQLHRFANVAQYNPTLKKFISVQNPEFALFDHIIHGDPGDGIPNILSVDNSFVDNIRQSPVRKAKVAEWYTKAARPEDFCTEEMLRGWHRNRTLIDFECIPKEIADNILNTYAEQQDKQINNGAIFNYFIKKRLKMLMPSINQFSAK